jgi:BASS family bile acid:Na+ symporter
MDILLSFVSLTIFTLMLTIGTNHSLEQLLSLWRERDVLLRGLFAALILVPAIVFVLLLVVKLPPAIATGLALLAAAPGAPLTTKRSQMAGADTNYIASLQLILALLAVVVTPVILSLFHAVHDLTTERVSPGEVAWQVGRVTFLPVMIGLLLRHYASKLMESIGKYINTAANVLFLLLVAALIVVLAMAPELRAQLLLGWSGFIVILIVGLSAVSIGHLLGGPRADQRAGLAIACLARNIGLAIFIASLAENAESIFPTFLVYMILGTAIQVPYSVWIKRHNTTVR